MNITELKLALPTLMKNSVVPFIWGQQGMGKTQVVKQVAKESKMGFVHLHLATQEVGDIIGLLINNKKDGTVSHAKPSWFPTEGNGILFLDECFIGRTQIVTDKGTRSISDIYKSHQDGEVIFVKSFNETTRTFEYKKVTESWNKGKKDVIGVKFNNAKNIVCTANHPFLTENGYVEASRLTPGTKVLAYIESKEKTATPALNPDQLQVSFGAVLGDGCLVQRNRGNKTKLITFVQGEAQKEYLKYKADIFGAKTRKIEKNGYAQTPAYQFHTRLLSEFYGMNKSQATRFALDNISALGLAIWVQDDGSLQRGSYTLHTEGWKKEDIEYAIEKLNDMGYECHTMKNDKKDGRKFTVIYVTASGSRKLSKDISKYVHPTMRYKLMECDRNVEFVTPNSKYLEYGYFIFNNHFEPKEKRMYVYDIEVENNHNFIVASCQRNNGVVVHNCNRAHPDVLQACFSLITDKTIHTHRLPSGWHVVAAGNYQSSMFNVTDTSDAAWMSRFCHIDFSPTKEEFIFFAENNKNNTVADFIRSHGEMLEQVQKEKLNLSMITPDRRSWNDMIGRLEKEDSIESVRYEIYSGIVGNAAAAAFMTYKKKNENKISGRKILTEYENVRNQVLRASEDKETRFDLLDSAVEEIFLILPTKEVSLEEMNNFKSFLTDVPLEMGLKIIKKLGKSTWNRKNEILNNKEYVQSFKTKKL
jgi:hypothetical protein